MNEYIDLLKSFGVPVVLIFYYLFIERPRQQKLEGEQNKRYSELMERVFTIESRTTEVIANNNNLLTILSERIKDLINK
jgi:hypothetical protein